MTSINPTSDLASRRVSNGGCNLSLDTGSTTTAKTRRGNDDLNSVDPSLAALSMSEPHTVEECTQEEDQASTPLLAAPPNHRSQARKETQLTPFRRSKTLEEDGFGLTLSAAKSSGRSPTPSVRFQCNDDVSHFNTDHQAIPLLDILSAKSRDNAENCQDIPVNENRDPTHISTTHDQLVDNGSNGRLKREVAFALNEEQSSGARWRGQHTHTPKYRKWMLHIVSESKKSPASPQLVFQEYRLHVFVAALFVLLVLSISLSYHFKNQAQQKLFASQAIFFDPRGRKLTLSDKQKTFTLVGSLGKEIPRWMHPIHCPVVMEGNPHRKQCWWKEVASLSLVHFWDTDSNIQCYNVSWQSQRAGHVPHDCFQAGDALWYGPSNQSNGIFPISGHFQYVPVNYSLNNNGLFNQVVDFYWLSSTGAAIYVSVNDPIQITWNVSGDGEICLRSNFSGPLYRQSQQDSRPSMSYLLCQGTDTLQTHRYMQAYLLPTNKTSNSYPPDGLLGGRYWSVQSLSTVDALTQEHVLQLVENVTGSGLPGCILTLDGDWQKADGDLLFDQDRFPNLTAMVELIRRENCSLSLSLSPYVHYTSHNFHSGVVSNMFVKDAGGEVTGLTPFKGNLAAILDVFTTHARRWYRERIQALTQTLGVTSFRLTYGHQAWLPYQPHFQQMDATPNLFRKHVTDLLSSIPDISLVVEHTTESRHLPSLVPIPTKVSKDGTCLTEAVETALTFGLMGYPYVMLDGFISENNLKGHQRVSRELYIRWLQLASMFPAYQFTVAPWEYDVDVVDIATGLSDQFKNLVQAEVRQALPQVQRGSPILRPIWWLDPSNTTVHNMPQAKTQFLIGDNLLVAPLLCEGVRELLVFIPGGVWAQLDSPLVYPGPSTVRMSNLTISSLLIFKRMRLGTGS